MNIRDLTVNDVFTVARIIGKVTRGAQVQLLAAITGKGKTNPMQVGFAVVQGLMLDAESDVKALLADLAGMTVEEFAAQPAAVVFDIVEALMNKEDAKAFFAKVSSLLTSQEA
jgi:hypothetical protein